MTTISIDQLIETLITQMRPIGDVYWLCSNWRPETVPWYTCGFPLGLCLTPQDLTNALRSAFDQDLMFDNQDLIEKRQWEICSLDFGEPGEYWLNPRWMSSTPAWHTCGIPLNYCATQQDFADRVQYVYDRGYLYDPIDYSYPRKWYALRIPGLFTI